MSLIKPLFVSGFYLGCSRSKCDVLVQHRDRVVQVLDEQELVCSWHVFVTWHVFYQTISVLHVYLP